MEILEEKFPAGMRVLAVDDNSTCLMILGALLRKCQYKVTTANQAVKALQILRENKNEFDLVISDIDMPDMDGFMLLQQLQMGLQMDIPVLLLSAHDDKEVVMKGITHGACHCLLKPVRIEELKNIWQHVVIRKLDPRQQVVVLKGTQFNVDHINGKPNKKRKDENKEYDDDDDQLGKRQHDEYEADPSSSTPRNKKPRVVWLPDLHRKFVAAVNQLGLDKAVPKRILELMNVENIKRENVASHLQKYRMYLKKFNSHVPISPQANMFADFGSGGYGQLVAAGLEINTQMTAGAALQCIEGDGGYTSYPVAATHVLSSTPASHECGTCSDITPIAAEFSSINFDANSCYFADNNMMMLDEHLLNAPQQEVSAGNLSSEYSLTSDSLPTLPKFDGYSDNSPTVLQFESFYYNEHGPSVDLRDNMATSSAAATAHLVINPHQLSSDLNSVVNILPDTITDLQHQKTSNYESQPHTGPEYSSWGISYELCTKK